jgi:phage-related protein
MLTFNPPVAPSDPLDDQHAPKVNRVQFGDAYAARSLDGINADLEKLALKWEHLTQTEFQSIWNFLVARGGIESFLYTVPWYSTGNTQRQYLCPNYNRTKHSINDYDITAQFEEVVEADNGTAGMSFAPGVLLLQDGTPLLLNADTDGTKTVTLGG